MSKSRYKPQKRGKYHVSDKTKFKQGRCTRLGPYWVAWTWATEFSSMGNRAIIIDWKTGRQVHCLSLGERIWYMINRWKNNITDINEQVVLYKDSVYDMDPPLIGTTEIAGRLDLPAINGGRSCTTSDFRVFYDDGSVEIVSIKPSEEAVQGPKHQNIRNHLAIEEAYWLNQSIPWRLEYSDDLNQILADNISLVTQYYDENEVFDDISYLKHLIATKQVVVDMESRVLDFGEMIKRGI